MLIAALAGISIGAATAVIVGRLQAVALRRHLRDRLAGPHRPTTRRSRARVRLPGRRAGVDPLDELAPALDELARLVRSGESVPAATRQSLARRPAVAAWFGPLVHGLRLGEGLNPLLARVDQRRLPADAGLAHRALTLAARTPSVAAEACERAARALRERRALVAERRAQAATARLSARVLTAVPLLAAGVAVVADPRVRTILLATPLGWACLAAGLGLNAIGRRWSRRLVEGGTR